MNKRKQSLKLGSQESVSSSLSTSPDAQCVHCGASTLTIKPVTRSFGSGDNLLIIEKVPMWACATCGESWFTAQTMHEIERIKAQRIALATKREVSVAAFEPVAA